MADVPTGSLSKKSQWCRNQLIKIQYLTKLCWWIREYSLRLRQRQKCPLDHRDTRVSYLLISLEWRYRNRRTFTRETGDYHLATKTRKIIDGVKDKRTCVSRRKPGPRPISQSSTWGEHAPFTRCFAIAQETMASVHRQCR